MVIMNLRRSERFKWENVIIVGILPAMSKEPPSLNHFLDPLVGELEELWCGIKVKTYRSPTEGAEMLHLFVVQQTYPLLANCAVLWDTVQIEAARTATSFSLVVSVKRRITVDLIAALSPKEPRIPIDKMLENY